MDELKKTQNDPTQQPSPLNQKLNVTMTVLKRASMGQWAADSEKCSGEVTGALREGGSVGEEDKLISAEAEKINVSAM